MLTDRQTLVHFTLRYLPSRIRTHQNLIRSTSDAFRAADNLAASAAVLAKRLPHQGQGQTFHDHIMTTMQPLTHVPAPDDLLGSRAIGMYLLS